MSRLLYYIFVWPFVAVAKLCVWTIKLPFRLLLLPFLLLAAPLSGRKRNKRNPSWTGMNDMFADLHPPTFIDYRDKWGSNNDHNWEADGDMRWDSYE